MSFCRPSLPRWQLAVAAASWLTFSNRFCLDQGLKRFIGPHPLTTGTEIWASRLDLGSLRSGEKLSVGLGPGDSTASRLLDVTKHATKYRVRGFFTPGGRSSPPASSPSGTSTEPGPPGTTRDTHERHLSLSLRACSVTARCTSPAAGA